MKKRFLCGLLLPILALGACATPGEATTSEASISQKQEASETPSDIKNFTFELLDDEASYCLTDASKELEGKVVIPSSYEGKPVTLIEDYAFEDCVNITEVIIPNSILSIDYDAFSGCSKLMRVVISSSVTSIGSNAFDRCVSLLSIEVDPSNERYSSIDGVLFNKDMTHLVFCPNGKEGAYVVPDKVTMIEGYAFHHCEKLTSISLPSSLLVIDSGAFARCAKLEKITLPKDLAHIGKYAFNECMGLTSIEVEAGSRFFASIDGVLFSADRSTLLLCPSAKKGKYQVPEGVYTIASEAFANCELLTSVTIGEGVRTIEEFAFLRCYGITSFSLPDSLLLILESAFKECEALESIRIPSGVSYIHRNAFLYDESLVSIDVDEENSHYASIDGVLFDKAKSKLISCPAGRSGSYEVPEGPTSILRFAFLHCEKINRITLSSTISNVEDRAFFSCISLEGIDVVEGNETYSSSSGVLLSDHGETALLCPEGKQGEFVAPSGLKKVEESAFYNCIKLTSVTLPEGCVSIGDRAFMFASSLVSLVLPASLTSIGESAFDSCSRLTSITFAGTKAQWNEIEKGEDWNCDTPEITVTCHDGELKETYVYEEEE